MFSMSSDLLRCLVIFTGLVYCSAQVPVNEFYSFGSAAGDQVLERQDDAFTNFTIDFDFPFFDQLYRQVFLSTNGIITFGNGTKTYIPKRYPLRGTPSVAAYWTDSNTKNGGDIFYRQEFDENTLNQITAEIRSRFVDQPNVTVNVSQWALIVTFANVSAFGCGSFVGNCTSNCSTDVVTYQAILTSNGIQSFAIFNFNQLGYTAGTADCNAHAQVGFNAGNGNSSFLVDGSNTPNISQTALKQSNVGKAGKWIFDTTNDDITSSCQSFKTLFVYPRRVLYFGRQTIEITGPCFDSHDNNVTVRIEQTELQCTLNDSLKIVCEVPLLDKLGRNSLFVTFKGLVYESFIMAVDVSELKIPSVNINTTTESEFLVTWKTENVASNAVLIKGFQEDYLYDGTGMLIERRVYPLDYGHFPNTGSATVQVLTTSSSISRTKRNVAGMISKASVSVMTGVRLVGAAIGLRVRDNATDMCVSWYDAQPSRNEMAVIVDQVSRRSPCPPSVPANYPAQLTNYILDKSCRPGNEVMCSVFHSGAKGCYRSTNNAGGPVAQCCYGSNDGLLLGPPGGGTLDMNDSETSLIEHWWKDVLPYIYCCYARLCYLYYKKRPSIDSTFFVPPTTVGGRGDPHFSTMDGTSYDFNPVGEFNYLLVNNDVIQTRIAQYVDSQNTARPASYFSAFVFKSAQSDIIEVDLNAVQQFRFKVNKETVSLEFALYQFAGISVNYESRNTVTLLMASGITAEIKILSRMLHIILSVPTSLKRKVRGLVGNWDDDTSNDFMLPNGTWIPIHSPRTDIHNLFGMAWSTTSETSLFAYPQGLTWLNYQNFRFVPSFVIPQPHPACGNDTACAYDVMATNDVNVGVSNIVIMNRIQEIREMYKNMLNSPSEITMSTGPSTLSTNTSPGSFFTSTDTSTRPSFTSIDKSTGPSFLSAGMTTRSPSTSTDTATGPPSSSADALTGTSSSITHMSTEPSSLSTDLSAGQSFSNIDTSTGLPSSSTDMSTGLSSSSTDMSTGPPSSSTKKSTGPSSMSTDLSAGQSFSNIDTSTGTPSSSTDMSTGTPSSSNDMSTGTSFSNIETSTELPSSSTDTSTGTSFFNIETSTGPPFSSNDMSARSSSSSAVSSTTSNQQTVFCQQWRALVFATLFSVVLSIC